MSDFKTRLVEEQVQLEEKLNKLSSFILSDNFNKIDDVQKSITTSSSNCYEYL
ncbi:shock protein C [Bacteroides phage PhiCrAssBcn5]|nr:shock protein C [Bacteroides phage PhiCrAssBcn4]WCF57691.1 shock protein C [Bacteroides phage PhiCrAssBcn5]WCF57754.1 shock protein C [Bacteroides phage PhiCrAssBcn6]WCF57935.1 shock protein C [Bacteroides phage PhiCrAssBcn7]WCF57993.1 shock protein C [Bacteroides phage PhiCrAssBcn8]